LLRTRYASIVESVDNPLPTDKVVLISGGTQGAGAGIARAAVVSLLSARSWVVTGSAIDWDQQVSGGMD
jgi:hypothetical protein